MLTEDEAKTKWCPMQRHSEQGVGGAYNRPTSGGFGCIASDCMTWRWGPPPHDLRRRTLYSKKTGEKVNTAIGADADWRLDDPTEPMTARKGFCGLAGDSQS
jgi:hypothetical protein